MAKKNKNPITVTETQTPYGRRRVYDGGGGMTYAEYVPGALSAGGTSPSRAERPKRAARAARLVRVEPSKRARAGNLRRRRAGWLRVMWTFVLHQVVHEALLLLLP